MTLPQQKVWAVENTRRFLLSLLVPRQTPRVPRAVRIEAGNLLKHYPISIDIATLLREDQ